MYNLFEGLGNIEMFLRSIFTPLAVQFNILKLSATYELLFCAKNGSRTVPSPGSKYTDAGSATSRLRWVNLVPAYRRLDYGPCITSYDVCAVPMFHNKLFLRSGCTVTVPAVGVESMVVILPLWMC